MTDYCRPPELESNSAASLVLAVFPFREVKECSVRQLPSYEDRNYYFKGTLDGELVGKGISRSLEGPESMTEFVLKLSNSSLPYQLIEGINAVTNYLKSKAFSCPYPLTSRKGKEVEVLSENQLLAGDVGANASGVQFCVRVLVFIPGETLNSVQLTPKLAYDVGNYIGRMDAMLQVNGSVVFTAGTISRNGTEHLKTRNSYEFSHPVIDGREFSDPVWDMRNFLQLRKYLGSIEDPHRKRMAETVIREFETHVQPKLASLKCGIIHMDINKMNVIVRMRVDGEYEVAGVIDFGDCTRTCCIFEFAEVLSKLLSKSKDPLCVTGPMLCAGYLGAFPLSREELECLYYIILARLCLGAVMTSIQFQREPWNGYVGGLAGPSWQFAEELLKTPKEDVDRMWAEVNMKN